MKIGIDAFPLCPGFALTGIPRSVREMLLALQTLDDENAYYLYSKLDFDFPFENPRWRKCLHPRIPFILGSAYLRDGVGGPERLDVFWATRPYLFPFGLSRATARILTVYDLVWRFYPETMSTVNGLVCKLVSERTIRRADRITAISESTRQDLMRHLGTPGNKIDVVHLGVSSQFMPRDRAQSARFVADKYGTSHDYICAVGTVEPRKNLIALMEAVRILRGRGYSRYQLLIAGTPGWKTSGIYGSMQRLGLTEREVKFLGKIPEGDLPLLYSGAALFVFPSVYEGFGLPLLEAMASGTPVVASNVSAMPEVVGEAGILVSPQRPTEIADAIDRVTSDVALSSELTEKGLKRTAQFTWAATARKIKAVLEDAAKAASSAARNR